MASRRAHTAANYLFLVPYGVSFLTFIILPFVVALVLAFCQFDLTSRDSMRYIGLNNFREAVNDRFFWRATSVTFRYVAMIIPAQLVLSMLLALGMHAMTRGRNTVRALLFLPGMFSIAVTGILWQWFYNGEFGLFNYLLNKLGSLVPWFGISSVPWLSSPRMALPSVVIMSLWWTLGGSSVIILTGLQQIPAQLFEAAAIDGASRWQTFWKVTLPMLKPVLLFMVVMNTIGAFQMFAQAMILTGGTSGPEMSTRGVVQLIYDTAFANYRLGYGAAISWLLFIMIAGFSLIQYGLLRRASE
jgi:ABC-type sugar transport system permease subunit